MKRLTLLWLWCFDGISLAYDKFELDWLKIKREISRMRGVVVKDTDPGEEFHREPISMQEAEELYARLECSRLGYGEHLMLEEFERAGVYKKLLGRLDKKSLVLYLASGFDGIPARIFGEDRVVMTTLDAKHYFSPEFVEKSRIAEVKKVENNMFWPSFTDGVFGLVILSDIAVFNVRWMRSLSGGSINPDENPVLVFFSRVKGLLKGGGRIVVTGYENERRGLPRAMMYRLKEMGIWVEEKVEGKALWGVVLRVDSDG